MLKMFYLLQKLAKKTSGLKLVEECMQSSLAILWVVPLPSNSHHQDYSVFRIGDPELNLHLPLASWEGLSNPSYTLKKQIDVECSQGHR